MSTAHVASVVTDASANDADADDRGAGADAAGGGTYTLLVEVPERATVDVGALGPVDFAPGWYAYVGSALGSGGFSRVERHRELAAGDRETRHWHVDYLLGRPDVSLDAVVASPGADAECAVARALEGERVPDFGCSDCGCDSHLVTRADRRSLLASVERAHVRVAQ